MTLSSGARFGGYEIIAPLGKGGMGEVYRAKDVRLNREVAIKILPDHLAQNADALKRFEREAKLLASLSHPNIVTIHDIGLENDTYFLVMELLEGQTLRNRISRSLLHWEKALQISIPIAEGLAAAHSKGVIHRDLKPENVFLTSDKRVKILDFGLARFEPPALQEQSIDLSNRSTATGSGIVVGTVPYMSPEQVRGESVDARTDIFSFGCLLYELITAKHAFSGNTNAEIAAAILRDEPPKLSDIPQALDHFITHCIEKNREERFQSARDLAFELRQIQITSAHSTSLPVETNRSKQKNVFAGIAIAIVAAVVLIVALNVGGVRERFFTNARKPIHSLAVLPLKNLSGDPNQEFFADGMTEELITTLARIEALRVISRTSVMEYKTAKKSLPQIAKELNVDAIVEGSVMKDANRVRITAQLVEASTDRHLWAEDYERDLSNILSLQNEVAQSIAQEIQIKLTAQDKVRLAKAPTVNPDAYQAYLRGLEYSYTPEYSEQVTRKAIQMFERAVELDPAFVMAYTELAKELSLMVHWGHDVEGNSKRAKAAIDHAFELKRDFAEGHLALGYYHYWARQDYPRALEDFEIATKSLPNNTSALGGKALVQRRLGEFQKSLENMMKIRELNPKDAEMTAEIGNTYSIINNYPEAERYYNLAIAAAPDAAQPYRVKAFNYWKWHGSTTQARTTLEKMPEDSNVTWSIGDWFWQLLYERNYEAALDRLSSSPQIAFQDSGEFYTRAQLKGLVYQLTNKTKKASEAFDDARLTLEAELIKRPHDPRIHSSIGVVYAGLQKNREAVREAKLAVELHPVTHDAFDGPNFNLNLALVYAMTDEHDLAFDQIEYLLSIPSFLSVPLLQLDPRWDPLRNHPRYAQLVKKYQLQSENLK